MNERKERKVIIKKKIYEILKRHEGISLSMLKKELKCCCIKTLKSIIVEDKNIVIMAEMKKDKLRRFEELNKCVVCGGELEEIREVTLKGDKIVIEKKCKVCHNTYREGKTGIRRYKIFLLSHPP